MSKEMRESADFIESSEIGSELSPEAFAFLQEFSEAFGVAAALKIRELLANDPNFLQSKSDPSHYALQSSGELDEDTAENFDSFVNPETETLRGLKDLMPLIKEVSAKYPLVEYGVLAKIVHKESRGNPDAESSAGAKGLCQVMPSFVKRYCKATDQSVEDIDPFDPRTNLEMTCYMLSKQLSHKESKAYLEKHPNRVGFVTYLYHHDGNAMGALKMLEKHGPNITEAEFMQDIELMPKFYLTYSNPFYKFLTIVKFAEFINGQENRDEDMKVISEYNLKEFRHRKEETTKVKEKSYYQDTAFVGDSVMVGSQPHSSGKDTDTAKVGKTTSEIMDAVRSADLSGKKRAVVCVGHNDMAALGSYPSNPKAATSYMTRVNAFIDQYVGLVNYLKSQGINVVLMLPHIVEDDNYPEYPVVRSQSRIINLLASRVYREFPDAEVINHSDQTAKLHPTSLYAGWREEQTAALERLE